MEYREETSRLRAWLEAFNAKLGDLRSSEPGRAERRKRREMRHEVRNLRQLLLMITGEGYRRIALEWSVEKPMLELVERASKIALCSGRLGVPCMPYYPRVKDLLSDYNSLYGRFADPSSADPRYADRLASIICFINGHSPPSAPRTSVEELMDEIPEFRVLASDFEILEPLKILVAPGNMYKARRKSTGEFVAIKRLCEEGADPDAHILESFQREVRALSHVKHQYLISFIGATSSPPLYIVTPYVKECLHDRIHSHSMTPERKSKIAYQIAEAMAYLHSNNVMHGDLKSWNILIDHKNEPQILDFGFPEVGDSRRDCTVGSPYYMAPEITHYGFPADVFSFGMLLYEMVAERVPFEGESAGAVIDMISQGSRPEIPEDCSEQLADLIKWCWRQEPARRPTFQDIIAIMEGEGISFGEDPDLRGSMHSFYEMRKAVRNVEVSAELAAHIFLVGLLPLAGCVEVSAADVAQHSY